MGMTVKVMLLEEEGKGRRVDDSLVGRGIKTFWWSVRLFGQSVLCLEADRVQK